MTDATASAGAGSANAGGAAGAAGADGAAAAAAGGGAATGGAPDFYTALPEDLRANPAISAYKKDTGFDFTGLAKEHVNLQALIGKKGIIPPGEKATPEEIDRFYTSLGRPAKPDGYQFQKPEGYQGYSDEFAGTYRTVAHKHGLTPQQAAGLHDWFVKTSIEAEQAQGSEGTQAAEKAQTTLRTEWGSAYDAKVSAGKKAFKAFASPEAVDKLEAAIGTAEVLRMFAGIGEKMGEDGLVGSGNSSFSVTPEQAKAEIAKMDTQMNDPNGPAMNKFHPEHEAWMKRREQLFAAAHPQS